ncbi:MAG: GNAT family N-acetyltransferase [Peptococcaceae bacterium]|jgi:hypothetical protein|nr:GNAT family N-acetyltransferase [Peptococcaceae bacterium]MDH7525026.1 GNAT family N-acetyltransferase [Peptococcaceae bacterium]
MKKIGIEPLSSKDLQQWSGMWEVYWKNNNHVLRTHEVGFYRYKYFDNPYARAYCCLNEDGRPIGFCGVILGKDRHGRMAAFSDVIFDPAYRMQGYAKEFVETLCRQELKDCPRFVFFPIDRNSFITWRFMFQINEYRELHRWGISLGCRDAAVKKLHFQFLNEPDIDGLDFKKENDYLKWRYFKHPVKHGFVVAEKKGLRAGYFAFTTVIINGVKGVEIGEIYMERQGEKKESAACLREMMAFLQTQGFAYMILKVPKGSEYDRFLSGWERSKKVLEKKYALFLLGQEQPGDLAAGEEIDAPREGTFITNLI